MAAKNGQKLFPEARGEITLGDSADLVLFEYQRGLTIQSTWVGGEKIS
jgi:adenine deaminase